MLRKTLSPRWDFAHFILIAGAFLCLTCLLLPSLPGMRNPLPPALRAPFVLLGVLLLPGYLLDELLQLSGPRVTLASPAMWFGLSCGALAPAGWFVLGMHTSLRPFGLITCGVILVLLCLVLTIRRTLRAGEWEFGRQDRRLLIATLILALTALGVSIWTARSADMVSYSAYVREYVDSEAINRWHPIYGEGVPVVARMRYNVWLIFQAFLAKAIGIDPSYVLPELLDPLLVILALLATFTLAKALFRSARAALGATALQIIAFLLSPGFRQPGDSLLQRMMEDKFVAYLIILPVAFFFILEIVTRNRKPAWWGMALIAAALVGVHAEVYALLLAGCGFFFVTMLLFRLPRERWLRLLGVVLFILPWSLFVIVTALTMARMGPAPGGPGYEELRAADLAEERILYVAGTSLFIIHPKLVFFPVSVAGLLATPFLLRRRLRNEVAALLFGNQVFPLIAMLVPGLPTRMARFVDYNTLWRFIWLMMPALTIAYVLYGHRQTLEAWWDRRRAWCGQRPPSMRFLLAGAGGLLAFLFWLSLIFIPLETIHPGLSWLRGPVRRWVPSTALYQTLLYATPPVDGMGAPTVLASEAEISYIPATWSRARMIASRGIRFTLPSFPPERQEEALERLALVASLPAARAEDVQFVERLRRLGVDVIVLERKYVETERSLDAFPLTYFKVLETASHAIYLVNLDATSPMAAVGLAQLALKRGERAEACEQIQDAFARHPNSPWVMAGMGACEELAGDNEQALRLYQEAMRLMADEQGNLDWPAALQPWLAWNPHLSNAVLDTVQEGTLGFLRERICYLERGLQAKGEDWGAVWTDEPAQTLLVRSSDLPIRLNVSGRPGDTLRARITAKSSAAGTLVLTFLAETRAGLELAASQWVTSGVENAIEVPIPPDGTGRLWLNVVSASEPLTLTVRALEDWSTTWIAGWLRTALVQPAGSLLPLDLSGHPGDIIRAQVKAEGPTGTTIAVTVLGEGQAGLKQLASLPLRTGSEETIEAMIPPDGNGRLWLSALSKDRTGSVTWADWRPYSPGEELPGVLPDGAIRDLAKWLAQQSEQLRISSLDTRILGARLGAWLGKTGDVAEGELSAANLLKNAGLQTGDLTHWNPQAATADVWIGTERRPDAADDWAAVIRSAGQDYQGGVCQTIRVQPGRPYVYLLQAQAELAPGSRATIAYWDYRRFGRFYTNTGFTLKETTPWSWYWRLVKVPAGVRVISVCPALLTGPGTIRFDRVWFIPLEAFQ